MRGLTGLFRRPMLITEVREALGRRIAGAVACGKWGRRFGEDQGDGLGLLDAPWKPFRGMRV